VRRIRTRRHRERAGHDDASVDIVVARQPEAAPARLRPGAATSAVRFFEISPKNDMHRGGYRLDALAKVAEHFELERTLVRRC